MSNRFQVTKVNNHTSSKATVNFGVPQGSILGPLLFTIYINDLPRNLNNINTRVYLYADDTAIFVGGKSITDINSTLNTELGSIAKWLESNYLTLNVKKTKAMLIGTHQKISHTNGKLNINIAGNTLENVHEFKYLGVWLDTTLSWNVNTEKIASKIKKRTGLLRRIRSVLPKSTLNMLYKSMIIPHFDYCDVVWGNTNKTNLAKLDTLQNTAGKVILGLPRRFPTHTLLNMLGWNKLSIRRSTHLNIMVYKSLSNILPSNLCNIFNKINQSHRYTTRAGSHGNLVPPPCRNTSDERKFVNRGVASFNILPTSAKQPLPHSLAIFKKLIS